VRSNDSAFVMLNDSYELSSRPTASAGAEGPAVPHLNQSSVRGRTAGPSTARSRDSQKRESQEPLRTLCSGWQFVRVDAALRM